MIYRIYGRERSNVSPDRLKNPNTFDSDVTAPEWCSTSFLRNRRFPPGGTLDVRVESVAVRVVTCMLLQLSRGATGSGDGSVVHGIKEIPHVVVEIEEEGKRRGDRQSQNVAGRRAEARLEDAG